MTPHHIGSQLLSRPMLRHALLIGSLVFALLGVVQGFTGSAILGPFWLEKFSFLIALVCLMLFSIHGQPSAKGLRVGVAMLPFMTFVAVALPLALLISNIDAFHHNNLNIGKVLPGYQACCYILLFGGIAQLAYQRIIESAITFTFALISLLILTHPWFHL